MAKRRLKWLGETIFILAGSGVVVAIAIGAVKRATTALKERA